MKRPFIPAIVVLISSLLLPQILLAQSQPAYDRAIDSVQLLKVGAGSSPSLVDNNPHYYVDVRGSFSSTDAASHDLSSRIHITADGSPLDDQPMGIQKGNQGVGGCATALPPLCSSNDCGGWLVSANWLGEYAAQDCEALQPDPAAPSHCGCPLRWHHVFGPYVMAPGALVTASVFQSGGGQVEIFTSNDSKSTSAPTSSQVPLPAWATPCLLVSIIVAGAMMLRSKNSARAA